MVDIRCRNVLFRNLQGIIFDKDGTLENSTSYLYRLATTRAQLVDERFPGLGDSIKKAFGVRDSFIDPAGLMGVGSRGENTTAAATYVAETGEGWIAAKHIVEAVFQAADRLAPHDIPGDLLPGSKELLDTLSQTKCQLGILSNAPSRDVEEFVAYHQIGLLLKLQMGADGAIVKPNPILFLTACERLDLDPARVLMIGDSAGDIEMAHRAGAAGCIAIAWGEAAPSLSKADVVIDHLTEIEVV
jgi:phosphoglycolate phosphatase